METSPTTRDQYHEEHYVSRVVEEEQILQALNGRTGSSIVTIIGPTGYGKTWLLHQLQSQLRATYKDAIFVWIDLRDLCLRAKSTEDFFLQLSYRLIEPLAERDKIMAASSSKHATAVSRFVNLMRNILNFHVGEYILTLDPGDGALGQPFQDDFYLALRACIEAGSQTESRSRPWRKLRLILTTSYPRTFLSTALANSPFNIGTGVEISKFTAEQTQQLAVGFGIYFDSYEQRHIQQLLGGHPALLNQCLSYVIHHNIALRTLLDDVSIQRIVFCRYLDSTYQQLRKAPALIQALHALSKNPKAGLSLDTEARLYSLGLIETTSAGRQVCRDLDRILLA